jgi:mannose-6-phosphate isomerase-like protein (cupin superfamily)
MSDYTAMKIDDMEAIYYGGFKRARAALGVESFGMQIIDMPPNADAHPEHQHDDQEEVYLTLRGSGEIEIDGKRVPLDTETVVRVGPSCRRKLWPGDEGIRVLALGGTPGKAYEPPDITKLGAPDPVAQG